MKRTRSGVTLLLLMLFISVLGAQNKDSIAIVEIQNRVFELVYSEPSKARGLVSEALKKSREIDHCFLEAASLNQLGIVYDVTVKYDSALWCYREAIRLSEKCGHEVMKGQALNNIGLIYWNRGELDTAINYYYQSLAIFEKYGREKGVANTLSNIGAMYTDKGDYKQAIPLHKKALSIREKIDDTYGVSVTYANLGKLYMYLDLDSARWFIEQSIDLKDSLNDRHGLGINYANLGVIHKLKDEPRPAIYETRRALVIRRELGEKNLVAADYYTLGGLYMDLGHYDTALVMLDSSEILAKEVDAKYKLQNIYSRRAELDTLRGDYKDAAKYLTLEMELQDEFFNIEKERMINDIQTKYETEKKERELAESRVILAEEQLKVKNRTNWTIVLIAVLAILVVSGFYIYRQQQLKQQKLRDEARLREELARAEVQARIQDERVRISRDLHDHIGSQLTIISSSIDNLAFKEKDDQQKQALYEIGDSGRDTMTQLRETIWAMNQGAINLEALMAKTREFVSRLKLTDQVIQVKITGNRDFTLGPVMAINLYRIIQEATNNALKYAHFKRMTITFDKTDDDLIIEVCDDGRGFEVNNQSEKGYGLANMRERVKEFNGQLLLDSRPGEGTRIRVNLNLPV